MDSPHLPVQRSAPTPAADPAVGPVVEWLGWGRVLRVGLSRAVLALLACLVFWSVLPMLGGATPRLVVSGSMEPRIRVGDVILTRPVPSAELTRGRVVTVRDPDHPGRTRTHRIVGVENGMVVTQGDANPRPDSSRVPLSQVLGVGVLRVPYVGRPAVWAAEGSWLALGATALVLGWCALSAAAATRRVVPPLTTTNDDGPSGGPPGPPGSSGSRRRRTAAAAAATIAAATAVSGPAQATFNGDAVNPTSTLAAASSFHPYRAAVTTDGPYLHWRLDETAGATAADQTAAGRDGAVSSGGSTWAQVGALLAEPGTTALATSGAAVTAKSATAAPGVFTVEAWVRTTSRTGGRVLGMGDGGGTTVSVTTDRQLYVGSDGKAYFGVGLLRTTVASTAAVNNGAWHHLVGTYNTGSNGMKLYVDGTLQGQTKATATLASGSWRAGAESLPGWTGTPGAFLEGTLDELAVYAKVLTAAQVTAHYRAAGY